MPEQPEIDAVQDVDHLELLLSEPSQKAIGAMGQINGDIIILGVGGKMGPTLARMARRASDATRVVRRVIGVSRFSTGGIEERLNNCRIETIQADLLDPAQIEKLPDAPNVVFMAGMKFGATDNEPLTWAMNSFLPGMVCQRYPNSRIVALSTGNIYGLTPVAQGGNVETDPPNPEGEYAMSCLGRERMFQYFSQSLGIPTAIIRLNYAVELRYGVLVDLAQKVWTNQPIDLTMGAFNVIWQADANAQILAAFSHVASPPLLLNVTGPEQLSVRQVSEQFGRLMGKPVRFVGEEASDALLSNSQLAHTLCGHPRVVTDKMIRWIANWIQRGGELLGKATHFESRNGKY